MAGFVQSRSARTANTTAATALAFNSNVTVGNFLVVIVSTWSASTITVTVSDNLNGSWTQEVSYFSNGNLRCSMWTFHRTAAGACTVTVTPNLSAIVSLSIAEYSIPPGSVIAIHNSSNATGSSLTPATGAVTASVGDFTVAGYNSAATGATTFSVASPFTLREGVTATATLEGVGLADDVGPTANETATFTLNSSGSWVGIIASFTVTTPIFLPRNQRWDDLPDQNSQWWQQHGLMVLTVNPPIQPSQRIESLLDFNNLWWQQHRNQPIPLTFLPAPFPQQRSQRVDPLPDFTYTQWEQSKQNLSTALPRVTNRFIQSNSQMFVSSAAARSLAYTVNVTAGSLLAVVVTSFNTIVTLTVSDNLNGSWSRAGDYSTHSGSDECSLWFFANTKAGACTVTVTPSAACPLSLAIGEWNIGSATSPVHATVINNGLSQTPTTGVVVASDGELVVAGFAWGTTGSVFTPLSPFTIRENQVATASTEGIALADHLRASGNEAAVFTGSSSSIYAAIAVSFRIDYPPPMQPSQRIESLPDYSSIWWEQFHVPLLVSVLPPSAFLPPQKPQMWSAQPDGNDLWWQQDRNQPVPVTFLSTPFPQQHDQRIEPLPDYTSWWEQVRMEPIPITLPPRLPASSQRIESLPDLNSWWEQYRIQPVSVTFLVTPFPVQRPQRIDPLPDYTSWWEQYRIEPVPATFLPTPFPVQHSQRVDPLPDYTSWWEQFHVPLLVSALPLPPATRQPGQRVDPLPDFNYLWWEQRRIQPTPVTFVTPGFPQQHSQRWDPLFDFHQRQQAAYHVLPMTPLPVGNPTKVREQWIPPEYIPTPEWWEQTLVDSRRASLPSWYSMSQEGTYNILYLMSTGQEGDYRIQNDIAGYVVWVGSGALPDLTQPPTVYSTTLPVSIPVTPPGSGTLSLFVLTAVRDVYGLVSQNQYCTVITVDSAGNLVRPALGAPQGLQLFELPAGNIRVIATYAGFETDAQPATSWKIWVKTTLPNPAVDSPVAVLPASKILTTNFGPQTPGTYFVMVGLYRLVDGALTTTYSTVVIHSAPPELIAVPSGFDGP
jgi:hypothetical protein